MSVTVTTTVSSGLYVPFRGFDREYGPAGTFSINVVGTGDGSAGTVTLTLTMATVEFGFHPIWAVTKAGSLDSLTTREECNLKFDDAGNERVATVHDETILPVPGPGGINVGRFVELQLPIEPNIEAGAEVLILQWSTNENLKVYQLQVFGMFYDAEAMARGKVKGKGADPLLGGIR